MLAPAQMPNCMSLRPSGPASNGSSTMARVPKRVTIAIPTATSSSSAPAVSSIAAMAEAPQMANPVPISRLRAAPSCIRFPSHVVTTSVTTRVPATSATVPTPSAMIEPNDTAKPEQDDADPQQPLGHRRERLLRHPGQQAGVAGDHAQSDGPGEDADRGHELVGEHRAPEAERGGDQPGQRRGGLLLGWPRRGADDVVRGAHGAVALDHGHAADELRQVAHGRVRTCAAPSRSSGDQLDRLRPLAEPGGRVEVADGAERVHPAPPALARARSRTGLPSGSSVLAATMLGNGSGRRGIGSQPCARSSAIDGYSGGQLVGEGRRRRQERADHPRAGCTARPSAR